MYHYPKNIEDNPDMFPTVACIPDAMLQKVDPANPLLVDYLQTINTSIKTGVLLQKYTKGPLKKRGASKKDEKTSPVPIENLLKSPKKSNKREKTSKKNPKHVVE